MAEVELGSLRRSLQEGDNMAATLQAIDGLLKSASSPARVLEIVSSLSLPLLFEAVSSATTSAEDEDELPSLACGVLGAVLSALPAEEVARQRVYLELGLQHRREELRQLCLEAIGNHLQSDHVREMVHSRTVFHLLTQLIGDDSLCCAKLASDTITSVVEWPSLLHPSLKSGLIVDLQGLVEKSDTVRFRVYDLVVRMSLSNEEGFEFAVSTGLLERLVSELGSRDVLIQINCVELVVQLMESRGGAAFLEARRVVDTMHRLLLTSQSDPLGSVLVPSLFKFYGHISRSERTDFMSITQRCPEFLDSILAACLSPEDETQWGVALDTLGFLGSTRAGRAALEVRGERSREVIHSLGDVIARGRSDLRVRALQAFAVFFSCPEEGEGKDVSWNSEKYFKHLHPDLLSLLMTLLRQPFDDLCTAALELLSSLAPHKWGQRLLSQQPGLLEYLVDRRVGLSKAGKEMKFEVVKTLVNSSSAEEQFGSPNFLKLRKFYREGPFFVTGEQALAMEESAE